MNRYESIFIITDKLATPDKAKEIFEKYKNNIKRDTLVFEEETHFDGLKTLAYECKGCKEGYFGVITFLGTPEFVADLERAFRIDDDIIKFMITRINKDDETPFTPAPPAKVNNSAVDAMDVLLGLDSYTQPDTVAPDAKSEQSSDGEDNPGTTSDKQYVYTLYYHWTTDNDDGYILKVYNKWEDGYKAYREAMLNEESEFKEYFGSMDNIDSNEHNNTGESATFEIWDESGCSSWNGLIELKKQEVK